MSTAVERGASSPQMLRRANLQALLRHALVTEQFTAASAMQSTGLTRATVLGVCAELVAAGLLEELQASRPAGEASRGRPAKHYSLRTDTAVIIGVDAGEHTLAAEVVDLRGKSLGTVRSRASRPPAANAHSTLDPAVGSTADLATVDRQAEAEQRRHAVRMLVEDLLAQAEVAGARRLLTVVGVPAPIDGQGLSPQDENGFWAAMNPGFADLLEGPVLVENDANLAAIAEHENGGDHLAALLMGERFGAGLILDGRLLRGARGGAGEMRFLHGVLGDTPGADGVAALARRWALEALNSGARSSALESVPSDDLGARDVFSAAREGDEVSLEVLGRIGDRLARIAAILASLLDVERVVVAGAIADSIEPVLEHARATLPVIATPPFPELVASGFGSHVVVRGALQLALTRLREAPLDLLDTPT